MRKPLALTMGDPAGIGGEIAVKAWRELRGSGPAFCALDDPARLAALGAPVCEIAAPEEAAAAFGEALPVLPLRLKAPAPPGLPDPANAAVVVESIRLGAELAMSGRVGGMVTNPIHKKTLYDGASFGFPGHTEFLAHLAGGPPVVMLLAGPQLKVAPVTIHIALSEAPKRLTREIIVTTGRALAEGLRRDFGIANPRIAVAGLNPHAGEGGAMGREEIETVGPAVEDLKALGIDARGPLPADTMFHAAARTRYDAALCMYHDQALIPIKTLDFDQGVNVTLGLGFIRTSPDHGTAYDIAGRGIADPGSLIAALRMAAEMAERRGAG